MSFWELRYPTTAGHEYSKIVKVQIKELKIDFIEMIEVLKKEMNKFFKEIYRQTNKQ